MKKLSLSEFLKSQDVTTETTKEQINQLKKKYWQQYHKEYYKERKKKGHRLTLRLSIEEYERLQFHAQLHKDISFSVFIKESSIAYLEQKYIPRDPDSTNELVKSIRKIGRVINQVVQSIHRIRRHRTGLYKQQEENRVGEYSASFVVDKDIEKLQREYEFLVKRITDIEQEVKEFISAPPKRIGEVLGEILIKEPSKIAVVRALLDEIEKKSKETNL